MVSLPKINVGKKTKRNYFNLTHDVNTTSDFGFCQPTICREFYKDSKITLKTKEFVRLGAMPCPTFGRIEVKTHTAFVPVRETFLAYDYLQSQKTVTSANRSYVPQCADYVTANTLLGSIVEMALDSPNNISVNTENLLPILNIDETHLLGRFSLWVLWKDVCPATHSLFSQHKPLELVDLVNDSVIVNDEELRQNSYIALTAVITQNAATSEIVSSPFYSYLQGTQVFNRATFSTMNTATGEIRQDPTHLNALLFCNYMSERGAFNSSDSNPFTEGTFGYEFIENLIRYSYLLNNYADFLPVMSLQNADFDFGHISDVMYQNYWGESATLSMVEIGFHLSKAGKRLFKVLTGCRISFGTKDKKIDLMRLLSYYKAWFDKYNPGRNLQWLDTNAFGLIHGYYDFGSVLDNVINGIGSDYQRIFHANVANRYRKFWFQFLYDIPQCCYVLPIDNMTCATPTPLLESDSMGAIGSVNLYVNDDNTDVYSSDVTTQTMYGNDGDLQGTGGLGVQLLNRIYHLVNKNSVIGSKIDEYLRAHNISRGLPHSNVLGDSKFMCNIDDVFATAGTSDAYLGEYAGKGLGSGSTDSMNFECESFGYLIQLLCVVPLGGYVQGMRDCPINRYDFYQQEFDSLGMEPMSKSNFINRKYVYEHFDSTDSVFGFRPRYFGLKIENNLANGGFAFRSQMAEYLPYSLDRIFNTENLQSFSTDDYVADEELRYIGRYEKFGNYDRIFYDTTGISDNFIVHMIQELSMYAPMKSISDSYDTFDKDVDDASINVDKA